MITTEVAFQGSQHGILSRLEVRSSGPNLMSALRQALFDLRVQVVRATTRNEGEHQVAELDVVEFDGAALRPARRHRIQAELSALLTARIQPPPAAAPPVRRGWKRRSRRAASAVVADSRVSW
jgi:hypothetical protein